MKKISIFLLVLISTLWLCSTAFGAIIVGRIAHLEGQIYRYMEVDQSWVDTFLDSPAGTQDVLATGYDSRAEIKFPNNMLIRLSENTEIEIVQLREDVSVFTLQRGLARFYNHGAAGSLVIETTRGTAEIGPGNAADVQVDEDVVIVAAAHGQTSFQLIENGVEKHEIISGSTSLEFEAESVIAGIGPIDRGWNRWCADRENLWAQNRLVHSEYLPETMQEHAYVLEPYGKWRRIYYRGYYYWAWQPRYVDVGWAPYTTGYWYDWQDEPVWIDHNPWGWATHHHGHWLHIHGAWMWTPYVHVSHVPGVTAVGFNIHFGKKYRPYWHPGRVRWVSYSSHIGWLPLAPQETYYGYRGWGPKSVVVPGGVNFSININLADHSYIDHAVIVPKSNFQRRRAVAKNHYNNVRIRNINKTVIINNYKPIPTAQERKLRKHITKETRTDRTTNRVRVQPEQKAKNRQEVSSGRRNIQKDTLRTYRQKKEQRQRGIYNRQQTVANNPPEVIGKRKNFAGIENSPRKVARSEQRIHARQNENLKNTISGNINSTQNKQQRPNYAMVSNKRRAKAPSRAAIQASNRATTRQNNEIIGRQNNSKNRRQVQKSDVPTKKSSGKNSEEIAENNRETAAKQGKQLAREQQFKGRNKSSWGKSEYKQQRGRGSAAASFNGLRIR